jgi:hypothetical protein
MFLRSAANSRSWGAFAFFAGVTRPEIPVRETPASKMALRVTSSTSLCRRPDQLLSINVMIMADVVAERRALHDPASAVQH